MHVFRDPSTGYKRPISAISWCPDGGSKIAIAYCNLEFQATHPDTAKESYVFNVGKKLKSIPWKFTLLNKGVNLKIFLGFWLQKL